jgi:hypothetical protein
MENPLAKTTTDHEAIRAWVEDRGGWPAEAEATAGEGGVLRVDFPGWSGDGTPRRIPWEDWFRRFDESSLAFVYEEVTQDGERSSFNRLVALETAAAPSRRKRRARRSRAGGRRKVASTAVARTLARKARTKGARTKSRSSRASGAGARSGGRTASRPRGRGRRSGGRKAR